MKTTKSLAFSQEALALAQERLERERPNQRRAFAALKSEFAGRYESVRGLSAAGFETEFWSRQFRALEGDVLPAPPFEFLKLPILARGMTLRLPPPELAEALGRLRAALPEKRFDALLTEDPVGGPPNLFLPDLTSHTQAHHMLDLLHYSDLTGARLDRLGLVVEWGGGYGGMAKLFRRFAATPPTYVIVDYPLMSCLQWLYLTTIFGARAVRLLDGPGAAVAPGAINLLPLSRLEAGRPDLRADLFVSHFALNESSAAAVEFVVGARWFKARRLFLSCDRRRFPEPSATLEAALKADGARLAESNAKDGAFYAYR
jgi:hypothetical protein